MILPANKSTVGMTHCVYCNRKIERGLLDRKWVYLDQPCEGGEDGINICMPIRQGEEEDIPV